MPIDHYVDHGRKLVVARGRGQFTEANVFAYQKAISADPRVSAYDELVDMSAVTRIVAPDPMGPNMQRFAAECAAQDAPNPGRFAIVAPNPLAFGLGRAYQAYRELQPASRKQVEVFRTLAEALAFLGIESLDDLPLTDPRQ